MADQDKPNLPKLQVEEQEAASPTAEPVVTPAELDALFEGNVVPVDPTTVQPADAPAEEGTTEHPQSVAVSKRRRWYS